MRTLRLTCIYLCSLLTLVQAGFSSPKRLHQIEDTIPSPKEYFQFSIGERPLRHHEIISYLQALSNLSPRIDWQHVGDTSEKRPLCVFAASSEANMARIKTLQETHRLLSDPRKNTEAEREDLIRDTPAIAWMMYNVHGNELSGADASVMLAYRLATATDDTTAMILDSLVVFIDPCQNPDGRERTLSQLQQWSGRMPVSDDQSIQHSGVWPGGRGNHYLFDMNRDWFVLSQQEIRSKVKAMLQWNPQLVVDAHEMGSFSTYFFNPPRDPINPHVSSTIRKWWKVFSQDQARAFDRHRWSYYTREDFDEWYPGYGSSWPYFSGAVSILYEQAGTSGSMVRRPDGTILHFSEAVHHQLVSSVANLTTAAANRKALLQDYVSMKKEAVKPVRQGIQAYVLLPGENPTRARTFVENLMVQGIEVEITEEPAAGSNLKSYLNGNAVSKTLPRGTYVISLQQPMRPLIEAILSFDLRLNNRFLKEERASLLKGEGTRMYEVSAWSQPLAYGVECYQVDRPLAIKTKRLIEISAGHGALKNAEAEYGFILDYRDDASVQALLRFFGQEYKIRCATKPFRIGGKDYQPGTLLLRLNENPELDSQDLVKIAEETGTSIMGVSTALCEEGPDLGSGTYQLLVHPRIALLTGPEVSSAAFGSLWYLLDSRLCWPHSVLTVADLEDADLRQYNLILMPPSYGNRVSVRAIRRLQDWISDGGSLVAIGGSAAALADSAARISRVELRHQALKRLPDYQKALEKEKIADLKIDSLAVWEGTGDADTDGSKKTGPSSLSREEERFQQRFMPRGAFLRISLNPEHWLAYGAEEELPAFVSTTNVFLAKEPVEAVARFAEGQKLRLSGLLWPEGHARLENTVYLSRESLGNGQIILFANDPYFRASTIGTTRLLFNALFFGPGLGARHPVGLR